MCVNKFPAILIYGFYKSTIIYLYLVPEDWSYMSERINQHLNPLVGNNIRRLRKERGLKATEVIAKLQLENVNVTTGIFSKVENGYNNPTVDMLVALTKIFECDFNVWISSACDTAPFDISSTALDISSVALLDWLAVAAISSPDLYN